MKVWMLLCVWLAMVAISIAVAGFAFDYSLWSIVGRDVPWYADCLAGVFSCGVAVPVAVICWVLRLSGFPVPFIHA